jgi:hypothetical protein
MRHTWFAALVLALLLSASAATPEALRVYAVEAATFDYVFTAAMAAGTNRVLSFNHRTGRTAFRRLGETLGEFTVAAFEPATQRVFNASINTWQERPGGRVTLRARDGSVRMLERGQPLPESGWAAWLIAADTGRGWYVREGDALPADAGWTVGRIGSNRVWAAGAGVTNELPWLAADEKGALLARLDRQRAALREARRRAEEQRRAEEERALAEARRAPAGPRAVYAPRGMSRTTIGTEYRYPTEFTVIPGLIGPSGQILQETVVVPSRFETRTTGLHFRAE